MAAETTHDLPRMLVASPVARKENSATPLIRSVGALGGGVSEPGCLVRSKLSKKEQGHVSRSCH